MSAYETMIVISSKLDEEATAAMIARFTNLISENGSVLSVDEWGKRRLAYEIQKETDGYYVLITFECDPSFIMELERIYRITDGLLRSLVVRLEHPPDAKTLKGGTTEPEEEKELPEESITESENASEIEEETVTEENLETTEVTEETKAEAEPVEAVVAEEAVEETPEAPAEAPIGAETEETSES